MMWGWLSAAGPGRLVKDKMNTVCTRTENELKYTEKVSRNGLKGESSGEVKSEVLVVFVKLQKEKKARIH